MHCRAQNSTYIWFGTTGEPALTSIYVMSLQSWKFKINIVEPSRDETLYDLSQKPKIGLTQILPTSCAVTRVLPSCYYLWCRSQYLPLRMINAYNYVKMVLASVCIDSVDRYVCFISREYQGLQKEIKGECNDHDIFWRHIQLVSPVMCPT